ncbi:MAG TPA: ABC transporter substrate-binding protein [Ignavibacteria bacterium]|nr:ABC transporter substrate-binding protein [Ignavibacteria bacterium]
MKNKIKILLFIFFISSYVYSQNKIGLALPLMESSTNAEDKAIGNFLLKGIKDAYEEFKKENSKNRIEIKLSDTERNLEEAFKIGVTYGKDKSILAILGPVFSNELSALRTVSVDYKIPIISPTATGSFIASEYENLFQLNTPFNIRGRIMAKYAMEELNLNNFLVLSDNTYGRNFSIPFISEISENNGKLIDSVFYNGTEEISQKITYLSKYNYSETKPSAIYISISNVNDIEPILQSVKENFPGITILGSSDWNNKDILLQNKNNINTLYYESDFYLDDVTYNNYIKKGFSESELKNYLLGYNSMNFLLQATTQQNDRSKLINYLNSDVNYPGIQNNINLRNRINKSLIILKSENGQIQKIKDYLYE